MNKYNFALSNFEQIINIFSFYIYIAQYKYTYVYIDILSHNTLPTGYLLIVFISTSYEDQGTKPGGNKPI